jgi:hypothetical protein
MNNFINYLFIFKFNEFQLNILLIFSFPIHIIQLKNMGFLLSKGILGLFFYGEIYCIIVKSMT